MQAVNRKKTSGTFNNLFVAKTDLVRLGVICSSNESHRNARFVSLTMYKRLLSSTNTTWIGEIVVGAGRNLTRDNLVCAISMILALNCVWSYIIVFLVKPFSSFVFQAYKRGLVIPCLKNTCVHWSVDFLAIARYMVSRWTFTFDRMRS